MEKSKSQTGVAQWPYRAVAKALEVIPRTLIANCGGNTIRTLTALRAKHAQHLQAAAAHAPAAPTAHGLGNGDHGGAQAVCSWGVNGESGELADMHTLGIWDPLAVKAQTYKTAIEVLPLY